MWAVNTMIYPRLGGRLRSLVSGLTQIPPKEHDIDSGDAADSLYFRLMGVRAGIEWHGGTDFTVFVGDGPGTAMKFDDGEGRPLWRGLAAHIWGEAARQARLSRKPEVLAAFHGQH